MNGCGHEDEISIKIETYLQEEYGEEFEVLSWNQPKLLPSDNGAIYATCISKNDPNHPFEGSYFNPEEPNSKIEIIYDGYAERLLAKQMESITEGAVSQVGIIVGGIAVITIVYFFTVFFVLMRRGRQFRKMNNDIVREYHENKNGELFLEKLLAIDTKPKDMKRPATATTSKASEPVKTNVVKERPLSSGASDKKATQPAQPVHRQNVEKVVSQETRQNYKAERTTKKQTFEQSKRTTEHTEKNRNLVTKKGQKKK